MKNVQEQCVTVTQDSLIKFKELRSSIVFANVERRTYKKVQVDGCAINEGLKCDYLLCSEDEREERFVELKGVDVPHAIEQLQTSISRLGEFDGHRHAYVVCTKVAPQISTLIQKAKVRFKHKFNAELVIKGPHLNIDLY